jgi:2-dehydro-3-deoxyphosphogluconate aldolase/(4S)-4-hydroxy-2-oxoglutarate aldolase
VDLDTFRWGWFEKLPIVGILRGFAPDEIERAAAAAIGGGLGNVEVTMNTPKAAQLIVRLKNLFGAHANIGAGTVCSLVDLDAALEAGATFIVTPILVAPVIRECGRRGVPIFPGAWSLGEIHEAFRLGATVVKVFPSDRWGASYIRSLHESFPEWRLMPTGGVTLQSLPVFYESGATAFGVGGSLFDPVQIRAGNWPWVTEQAKQFAVSYDRAKRASLESMPAAFRKPKVSQ